MRIERFTRFGTATALGVFTAFGAGCRGQKITHTTEMFGGSFRSVDAQGSENPLVKVDLASLKNPDVYQFPFRSTDVIEIRSAVHGVSRTDAEWIRSLIERSYDYVERATGLSVPGGTLLFLIELDYQKNSVSYSYTIENTDKRWSRIDDALFLPGESCSPEHPCASLYQLLLETLPHELTHEALNGLKQLEQDRIGGESSHTRWFVDGLCDVIADGFARQENPRYADALLAQRPLATILEREDIRKQVLQWVGTIYYFYGESHEPAPPPNEADLYGAAFLLVKKWTESCSPADVLRRIGESHERVDGKRLLALVKETTGMEAADLVEAARRLGQSYRPTPSLPEKWHA